MAALLWQLGQRGLVVVALVVVLAVELWPIRYRLTAEEIWARVPQLVVGASCALIIALLPKVLAQLGVAGLYAAWRIWQPHFSAAGPAGLLKLLVVQIFAFEALFLMAAIWRSPRPLLIVLVWVVIYVTTYQALAARGERAAGLLAAAWALTTAEASWIFLTWLVSYVSPGQYIIVPQAALVLSALAYCFGSIYTAQRQGQLNRMRLSEYLLIGLLLIWIVIAGTSWRGSL